MLTDEEQQAFRESVARVRRRAADSLRTAQRADAAIGFIANLHRSLDVSAAGAAARGPLPECKPGCAHCCRVRVEATDVEIFRIAQAVRQLPEAQRARRIALLRQRVADMRLADPPARSDCAFLEDECCAIYEVRPAACRRAHSLSASACERKAVEIPQDLARVVEAEALISGTTQAYREVNLPAGANELSAAVLAALEDDSLVARWFQGEACFGSATGRTPYGAPYNP